MSIKNIRIFLEEQFEVGKTISLTKDQVHYLLTVLRLHSGDTIKVFNGENGEWGALVDVLSKKACSLHLQQRLRPQPDRSFLGLIFPPIRQARLDFMIEKATELGVTDFFPVQTDHTVISKINPDRLMKIAIEATEQSERLIIPQFHLMNSLKEVLKEWNQETPLLAAIEREQESRPIKKETLKYGVGVLIGPEGGFSPKEKTLLHQMDWIHPVSLGDTILRAETAAIVMLGAVIAGVGDIFRD